MLTHAVRLTAEDANGWTAPMVGVRAARWQAVDMMLAAGADPTHVAKNGLDLVDVVESTERQRGVASEPVPPELLTLAERMRHLPRAPH